MTTATDDRTPLNDSNLLGYDDKLTNNGFKGPVTKRKCTDVFFLILFVLFVIGMFAVSIDSFVRSGGVNGYKRLVNGIGSDGRICGINGPDGAGAANPKLFYAPTSSGGTVDVCLPSCPTGVGLVNATLLDASTGALVSADYITYPCTTVLNFCYPAPSSGGAAQSSAKAAYAQAAFGRVVSDLGKSWEILPIGAVIAMLLALAFLMLTRYCGGVMVWGTLLLTLAALVAAGILAWQQQGNTAITGNQQTILKVAAVVAWLAAAVLLLVMIAACRRINLAVAVMGEATHAVQDMKGMLALPAIKFLAMAAFLAFWVASALAVVSSGNITLGPVLSLPGGLSVQTKSIVWSNTMRGFFAYLIFALLWVLAFLLAVQQLSLATAAAHWYFSPPAERRDLPSPVSRGVFFALRYHAGSLALGSLIIAVIQFLRVTLEYVDRQVKAAGEDNRWIKCLFCCCRCCLWCLEKCMKFVNRNAYIMMAIYGHSFCDSAKKALALITRNVVRVGALNLVGAFFLRLGTAVITGLTLLPCYLLLTRLPYFASRAVSPLVPMLLVAAIAFVVASLFMEVFGMTMDTLLICVIADEEMHHGQAQFASAGIIRVLDDHQKERGEEESTGAPITGYAA